MNLYRKHRPTSWEEIWGNEEVVSSLSSMLKKPDKCGHAFLLTGQTGCGKTTIGRLIATTLKVKKTDLQEINSSDFRGIDTVREIIKSAQFKPMDSKYRGFLMDEVHQLTKDSQNALLKILEDTPSHVFFILCTTDPQKLLATVKNRCSLFELNPLSEREMKGLIKATARKEKTKLEKEVIGQIIETAEGRPRNALQILEQVLAVEPEMRLEAAKKSQEVQNESIDLCRALISNSDWNKVKTILQGLRLQDPESIRRHVLGYAQSVLLKTDNTKAGLVLEEFLEPTYNSGFPQLVFACYSVIKNS